MFYEFHRYGVGIYINLDFIATVDTNAKGTTVITLKNREERYLDESYDEVKDVLENRT